jgi:hypothetical protein
MQFSELKLGDEVIFDPVDVENIYNEYFLAGVNIGDKGVVVGLENEYGQEDVIVDFTTQTSEVVDGFYTTPEDVRLA